MRVGVGAACRSNPHSHFKSNHTRATHVPTALFRYLNPGGRMVLPLAQPGDERGTQRLTVLEAAAGGIVERTLDAVRFVPLLSGLA